MARTTPKPVPTPKPQRAIAPGGGSYTRQPDGELTQTVAPPVAADATPAADLTATLPADATE